MKITLAMTIRQNIIGITLAAVVAAVAPTGGAVAQTAERRWSLEKCIHYAVEHNIEIKQLEISRQQSEIALNTSQMSRLPNLNAEVGQNWNFGRTQTETGLYENRSQSNTSMSVGSTVPLFTGFRISNEIARDKLQLEAATADLDRARDDLALNVASLFLQTLFNRELLEISRQQLDLSLMQVERTQLLVAADKAPESQLYDIRAQAANDKVAVVEAENTLQLSLLDLAQNLELEPERRAEFDVVVPEIDSSMVENLVVLRPAAVIYDVAVQNKPVIRAQELATDIAEKSLKIARAGYLPTLSLSFGYGTNYFYLYNKDYVNPALGEQLRNNGGEYLGLSLSIPVFNRFTVRNQVRTAQLNVDSRQLSLEKAKKDLYKQIQTAYFNAAASLEKYRAAKEAVRATAEAFRYAQVKYEAGKATVFEFSEAKNKYSRSLLEEVQAKYDCVFRAKILDFYYGTPIKMQ